MYCVLCSIPYDVIWVRNTAIRRCCGGWWWTLDPRRPRWKKLHDHGLSHGHGPAQNKITYRSPRQLTKLFSPWPSVRLNNQSIQEDHIDFGVAGGRYCFGLTLERKILIEAIRRRRMYTNQLHHMHTILSRSYQKSRPGRHCFKHESAGNYGGRW
jgi:hypothetical protein